MQPSKPRQAGKSAQLRCKRWMANRFYVSRQHRLLYCPIPKVACTSLKLWFAEKECGTLDRQNSEIVNPHLHYDSRFSYGQHADELGTEPFDDPRWFRFAFVRNPWARLVSAFLNKFVCWWGGDMSDKLIDEFRRGLPKRMARQLFTRQDTEDRLAPWWLFRNADAWNKHFTFRQFVNHLTTCDLATADGHWRPQSEFLGQVEFHFIGRFEQLDRDFAELNRLLGPKPALRQMNVTRYAADRSTEECVADWPLCRLRELSAAPHYRRFYTPSLAKTVGRLYAEDAERFGYEFGQEMATKLTGHVRNVQGLLEMAMPDKVAA